MKKKIRIVQYGLGPIGSSIVRLMSQKDSLEIVGAIDKDPAKAGRDLGEVVGAPDAPWGVPVSPDAAAVLEKPVDVIVHSTSSYLDKRDGTASRMHRRRLLHRFHLRGARLPIPQASRAFEKTRRRRKGRRRRPGRHRRESRLRDGQACSHPQRRRPAHRLASAVRIVDASKRRLPLQKKIGAGMTPEEFREQVAAGVIKHHGLPESIAMVADGLGFSLDDISETIEPVIAEETIKTEFLEVAPGQVAGVHQVARGVSAGKKKYLWN